MKRSAVGAAPNARPNARRSPHGSQLAEPRAVTVLRSCGANCVPATPLSAGRSTKSCEPSGEWPARNSIADCRRACAPPRCSASVAINDG